MESAAGAASAAAGHSSIPVASERNEMSARERKRKQLNDILYPGALTSRQKRYAAEPAPDGANLTLMCERSANGSEIPGYRPTAAGTDRPVVRQSRSETSPGHR